jgi:cytochrome P450
MSASAKSQPLGRRITGSPSGGCQSSVNSGVIGGLSMSAATSSHAPSFDLADPALRRDPYPAYEHLREEAPVHLTENGLWVISRYAECAAILKDRRWSSDSRNAEARGVFSEHSEIMQTEVEVRPYLFFDPPGYVPTRPFLFLDAPDHTRLRTLVSKAFTASALNALRPRVERLARGMIDRAASKGAMEIVSDLAYPLPVAVICDLLGVPMADESLFHRWSPLLASVIEPDFLRTPEEREKTREALGVIGIYFQDLIARREKSRGADLLSELIAAEHEGQALTGDEILATCLFLLIAGHETTVNLIANGALALLENPAQLHRLVGKEVTGRAATEELLRYDSPVQIAARTTTEAVAVADAQVPAGAQVLLLLGSANRDAGTFDEPDRLDLARANASRHLAFGSGVHSCLGAPLARMEGEIALSALGPLLRRAEVEVEPRYRAQGVLRGLDELRLRF